MVPMLAEATAGSTDLITAFSNALTSVKGDCMSMISTALPVTLAIVGAVIAVSFGIKFFKRSTK